MGTTAKYDVGILGLWSGCNYGSVITYYALQQTIAAMGKSVLMVDKPILSEKDVEREDTHARRFGQEHYHISPQYRLGEMGALNGFCDAFVIGSDQVWNYGISRNFGKMFYFDFAEEGKKKIAYGVSFGHGTDFAPPEERKRISAYMRRMDGIAVRESDGVRLCRDAYGIRAVQVLDPVFLADPGIYVPLVKKSQVRPERPFLVAYILDPTPAKREAILHLALELGGLDVVPILDGLPWKFQANQKLMSLPGCIENLQTEDWLSLISRSEFVVTDSCHGASFALIFRKRFVAFPNQHRGISRFSSLGALFHVEDRIVADPAQALWDRHLLDPVDYGQVDAIMAGERARCHAWLKERLEEPKRGPEELERKNRFVPHTVADVLDPKLCTGCGACASTCPKDAISLQSDRDGYYRAVVDGGKCVSCGKCIGACPAHALPERANRERPACYAFQAAEEAVLNASSSGGAFPVLAGEAFARGGAVAGAAWREDFLSVGHILIEKAEELPRLQKSKYLQSYTGTIFRDVRERLERGAFVLFSGTPCQVAGLKKYLGRDYENLLLVDILCSYVPSTIMFSKYATQAFPDGVESYEFRHKPSGRGWDCVTVRVMAKGGAVAVRRGGRDDDYQRVYHNHTMCPPHCEQCKYQAVPRHGDLTIGDFWGLGKRLPELDVSRGMSVILCNNVKGAKFLESVPKERIGFLREVPLAWLGGNGYAINGSHNYCGPKRDLFYVSVRRMGFREAVDWALKPCHGIYPEAGRDMPLSYRARQHIFDFDPAEWEEHCIQGVTTLFTKREKPPAGLYATMPLRIPLERGKEYVLEARFRVRTASKILNFHVKDSGSRLYQVIHTHRVHPGEGWVTIRERFVPNSGIYDEIMFGASQIVGEGSYLAVDWIRIVPVP